MLGIIIGVMSLISLVSVAQGATSGIESQFKDLGARNLTINSNQTKYPTLTLEDASAIAEIPGVAIVSKQISTPVKLSSKNSSAIAQLIGVDADFIKISEPEIFVGSFLPNQSKSDTKSIVLSTTLANELKLNTDAINQTISVGTTEFKIVGILDDADQFRTRDVAYIPIESHFNYFSNKPYLQSIIVQTLDENVVPTVTSSIVLLLNERHNISGNKKPDYVIVDASQILDAIGTVQQFLSLLLGGIASISLVVGGIGIMNIMLAPRCIDCELPYNVEAFYWSDSTADLIIKQAHAIKNHIKHNHIDSAVLSSGGRSWHEWMANIIYRRTLPLYFTTEKSPYQPLLMDQFFFKDPDAEHMKNFRMGIKSLEARLPAQWKESTPFMTDLVGIWSRCYDIGS
jgi:hypothetical protein